MNEIWMNVLESVYPVGSVYISTINTPPPSLFGFGEWQQIKDVFLLCAGDTYTGGESGGEAAHTLNVSEIPAHTHKIPFYNSSWSEKTDVSTNAAQFGKWSDAGGVGFRTVFPNEKETTGGGKPHNNMPPYLTVYAWQRIS